MIERNIIPSIFGRFCSRVKEASRPCRSRTRPGCVPSWEIRAKAQPPPRRARTEDSRVRASLTTGSAEAARSSTSRSLTANDETVPNPRMLQNEHCGRFLPGCRAVSADVSRGVGPSMDSTRNPRDNLHTHEKARIFFCSIGNLDKSLQLAASIALFKPFRSCSVSES